MLYKSISTCKIVLQLSFPSIRLTGLEVCIDKNNQAACSGEKNVLRTFMMQTDVDMSHGLDFFPRGSILARITHLNHEAFTYRLSVFSQIQKEIWVVVRIFMAPAKDFAGSDMLLDQQKHLMMEMDRFTAKGEWN